MPKTSTRRNSRGARPAHAAAFRSVLVPTDFSVGAQRALLRAARLSFAHRARLHLVHVVRTGHGIPPPFDSAAAKRRLEEVVAGEERLRSMAGTHGCSIELRVLEGDPHVEIIRHAREVDAELIVLGRKGAGQRLGRVLGTTAARVLRMSDTPVLVVTGEPAKAYDRPLIALPLDPSARKLFQLVQRIVGDRTRRLDAVRVFHAPFEGLVPTGTDQDPTDYHRSFKESAARAVQAQTASLATHGIRIDVALRRGETCGQILAEAARCQSDLLALCTHARSGVANFFLGSVAECVIVAADCDVLISRPVRFTFEPP